MRNSSIPAFLHAVFNDLFTSIIRLPSWCANTQGLAGQYCARKRARFIMAARLAVYRYRSASCCFGMFGRQVDKPCLEVHPSPFQSQQFTTSAPSMQCQPDKASQMLALWIPFRFSDQCSSLGSRYPSGATLRFLQQTSRDRVGYIPFPLASGVQLIADDNTDNSRLIVSLFTTLFSVMM